MKLDFDKTYTKEELETMGWKIEHKSKLTPELEIYISKDNKYCAFLWEGKGKITNNVEMENEYRKE